MFRRCNSAVAEPSPATLPLPLPASGRVNMTNEMTDFQDVSFYKEFFWYFSRFLKCFNVNLAIRIELNNWFYLIWLYGYIFRCGRILKVFSLVILVLPVRHCQTLKLSKVNLRCATITIIKVILVLCHHVILLTIQRIVIVKMIWLITILIGQRIIIIHLPMDIVLHHHQHLIYIVMLSNVLLFIQRMDLLGIVDIQFHNKIITQVTVSKSLS